MPENTQAARGGQDMGALAEEVKRYLRLQKRYMALDAVERMTRLFSAVGVTVVCLILGAMVLFFTLYALAEWAGALLGYATVGFLVVAALLALLAIVFYSHRQQWVVQPLARLMAGLFLDGEEEEEGESNE
ncbi:MAG: phage holin family protein [Bacteroidaceae bacterium]